MTHTPVQARKTWLTAAGRHEAHAETQPCVSLSIEFAKVVHPRSSESGQVLGNLEMKDMDTGDTGMDTWTESKGSIPSSHICPYRLCPSMWSYAFFQCWCANDECGDVGGEMNDDGESANP